MKIVKDNLVNFKTPHSKEWDENVQEIIDSLPKAKKFIFIWQEENEDKPMYEFYHVSGGTMKGDFVFIGAYLQYLHLKEIFEREEECNE
jgi:hypothetical protein